VLLLKNMLYICALKHKNQIIMKAKVSIKLSNISEDLVFTKNVCECVSHSLGKNGLKDKVFLLAFEQDSDQINNYANSTEILVTENLDIMRSFVETYFDCRDDGSCINVYLQEYDTYEDAIKVQLEMRETNKYCYNECIRPNSISVSSNLE